jgi:hypothetical protein
MTDSSSPTPSPGFGFLSILREPTGYVGGYLVTNPWGRPLEFRLSSAVQPNRVQQILYGDSLEPYICGDLIAKTLVEKTTTTVQAIFTDFIGVLELRRKIDLPIAFVQPEATPDRLRCHSEFTGDGQALRAVMDRLGSLDLAEPFLRIREAITEARKMGISGRTSNLAA